LFNPDVREFIHSWFSQNVQALLGCCELLAERWTDIAQLVGRTAAHMAAQHDLPMGAHDQTAWGEAHLKAFEKFVKAQTQMLALLRVAAERDDKMLASMTKQA
jgi:hypothetical protein